MAMAERYLGCACRHYHVQVVIYCIRYAHCYPAIGIELKIKFMFVGFDIIVHVLLSIACGDSCNIGNNFLGDFVRRKLRREAVQPAGFDIIPHVALRYANTKNPRTLRISVRIIGQGFEHSNCFRPGFLLIVHNIDIVVFSDKGHHQLINVRLGHCLIIGIDMEWGINHALDIMRKFIIWRRLLLVKFDCAIHDTLYNKV